jgi:ketosteroid isomerase-like protein
MKILISCIIVSVLIALGCASPEAQRAARANVTEQVAAALKTQTADWNRGDIEAFMRGYWNDAEVRFGSGGNIKRGWNTVLNDYVARYPDRASMGALETADLEITEISPDAALIFGRWIVTAGETDYCGLFTLLVRNIEGRWVIVHDHTSSADGTMADGRSCSDIKATT